MKLICCDNIFSKDVNDYLLDILSSENDYLYLSNSPDIILERKKHKKLESFFNDTDTMYFKKFLTCCANEVYQTKNYLPNSDMRYILKMIIKDYFTDEDKRLAFDNISYDLFNLYKILIMNDINVISKNTMELIKKNNIKSDFYIFDIYNKFIKNIEDIVYCISNTSNERTNKITDLKVLTPENADKNFNTFIYSYKNNIYKKIFSKRKVILDGFFYFPNEINFILKCALNLKKDVTIVTKNINENQYAEFLIREIKNNLSIQDSIEYINFPNKPKNSSGLSYLRNNFYSDYNFTSEKNNKFYDGSINIVEPFLSRDKEIEFVTKEISNIIQRSKITDTKKLEKFIRDEIVIITAVNYTKFSEEIDNAFKKFGLFVRNDFSPIRILGKDIDVSKTQNIYYSLDDFLNENIMYCDGIPLNIDEKILYFSKCYSRIRVRNEEKPFIISPVLEYVFQLYEIFKNGISRKRFKLLLFSNWYYHTGKVKVKWDKYVGVFNQIESFFKDNTLIVNWIMKLQDMLNCHENLKEKKIFKLHPFNSISKEDMEFLLFLLKDIDEIINSLSKIKGSIQFHLDFLKENIINSNGIFSDINEINLSDEQKSIRKFYNHLQETISYSVIQNVDTKYFSEYLYTLFSYLEDNDEPEQDRFYLKLSTMINLKNYRYTFFIGCENSNYPRKNIKPLISSDSIKDILTLPKYGLMVKNSDIKSKELNLNLEKYLFKNVMDFTLEKIYYTSTQYTEKGKNKFSDYIEDIALLFNQDTTYNYSVTGKDLKTPQLNINSPVYAKPKNQYSLKELVTFCLCPKLYYHLYLTSSKIGYTDKSQLKLYAQSVLYSDLLNKFMDYNMKNKKWYIKGENEVHKVLNVLLEETARENFKYFDCLSIPDLLYAKDRAKIRIEKIIEDYIIDKLKYYKYTIVASSGKSHPCGNFDIILEYDTAIFSDKRGSKKIEQNNIFLDFLTLKCTDREVKEKHYKDMLTQLKSNNKFVDRVFFSNRILSKINVQFSSNNDKFINGNDGAVERVNKIYDDIINTDFSKILPQQSKFCDYCIVKNICMGGKESQRNLVVIE